MDALSSFDDRKLLGVDLAGTVMSGVAVDSHVTCSGVGVCGAKHCTPACRPARSQWLLPTAKIRNDGPLQTPYRLLLTRLLNGGVMAGRDLLGVSLELLVLIVGG